MSERSLSERAEEELLLAEIEALQERRATLQAQVAPLRARLRAEAASVEAANDESARLNDEFGDLAARAKALEARVEEVRREAATWRELGDAARADASKEIAACKGLYARLATTAVALGDDAFRRWARRGMLRAEEGA